MDIRNLSHLELQEFLKSVNEKPFRADQIFEWIYQKDIQSFEGMSNLSKDLRHRLDDSFDFSPMKVDIKQVSEDGTTKYLFELSDGQKVETVMIPTKTRATVCVSTQAGCKFGCRFCASGIGGWKRNLSVAEILGQILHVKKECPDERPLSHLVFMGIGEPLDNYDNLYRSIQTINSPKGIHIGARRITVSTCGVVPKIKELAEQELQIELAISLHGFDNESRNVLMPVNKKWSFEELMDTCRYYIQEKRRQITFEYIMIKDVTCTPEAAKKLKAAFKGLICKINLIPYNPVHEFDHQTPTKEAQMRFKSELESVGVHATIRTPRGRDVAAACGQLRHEMQSG